MGDGEELVAEPVVQVDLAGGAVEATRALAAEVAYDQEAAEELVGRSGVITAIDQGDVADGAGRVAESGERKGEFDGGSAAVIEGDADSVAEGGGVEFAEVAAE